MNFASALALCLGSGNLLCALTAQTTHVVGPGGYAQIRDALAVAAPGDRIDVHPGTYAHFEVTSGVTLRALQSGTVSVAFDPAYYPPPGCSGGLLCVGSSRINVPAGQEAHVQGLVFLPSIVTVGSTTVKHNVLVAGGRVTFDSCEMAAYDLAGLAVVNADARLVRSRVIGQPSTFAAPVVSLLNSTLSAVDCTIDHLGALFNPATGAGIRGLGLRTRCWSAASCSCAARA